MQEKTMEARVMHVGEKTRRTQPLPRDLRQSLTRAMGYLERMEAEKAMQSMVEVLSYARNWPNLQLRRALAVQIRSFLEKLVLLPKMQLLLEGCVPNGENPLPYREGQEGALAIVLEGLCNILHNQEHRSADAFAKEQKMHGQSLLKSGYDYLARGQSYLAFVFFLRFVEECPLEKNVWKDICQALQKEGCVREAQVFLEKVLVHQPKEVDAWRLLISLSLELGQYARAEKALKDFVGLFGWHPRTYLKLAQIYKAWGRKDECQSSLAQALALDPTLPEGLALLKELKD